MDKRNAIVTLSCHRHEQGGTPQVLSPEAAKVARLQAQDAMFDAMRSYAQTQAFIERSIQRIQESREHLLR